MNLAMKKHLPRRTFLRGVGTALALPLLDSMVPAFAAKSKSSATCSRAPQLKRACANSSRAKTRCRISRKPARMNARHY